MATWQALVRAAPRSASWPVIISQPPGEAGLGRLIDDACEPDLPSARELIHRAALVDGAQLLDQMWEQQFQYDEEARDHLLSRHASDQPVQPIRSELVPASGSAVIGLFPCADSFEIPAILGYGGWNGSPEPHEHVAALRYWQQRFEARLLAISTDTIELLVGCPPEILDDATDLTEQHVGYCSDSLDRTILELATVLMTSEYWHFWWD